MRWFKHMTDSADDEKLAALIGLHGMEGYGLWWFLIEAIAKQIPKDGTKYSVSYPLSYWLRLTGIYHRKKFKEMIQSMHNLGLISAQSRHNLGTISNSSMKDVLIISCPNLLKFRDEYSKKSRHNKDSVNPKIQNTETEGDNREKEIKPLLLSPTQIGELYMRYAGIVQYGSGQVAVFKDLSQRFSREIIEEAFQAAASANIQVKGFLNWCIKRMERAGPQRESFDDFLDGLPGGES